MSFELTLDNIKRSYLTLGFISVNFLVFLIVNLILGDDVLYLLAQNNNNISQGRELWTLITSFFVHANFLHLFNNILGLLIFGSTAEKFYSKWQYLMIYFLSGLMGSIFSFLLSRYEGYGLGASGVVFGLMGAVMVLVPKEDRRVYLYSIFYIIYSIIYSFAPGIGTWAHIFGLITGIGIGIIIKKKKPRKVKQSRDFY
ncbi:rhomboid family intramembrane serine protease [Promethearchaeum syntrophicum]|uniref:Rhomboid family intramembrane serine protease n=1 Tax=Promethearchaeum syntrophicum TaxID=2594042 RepID=A0A5B9DEB5_9ARCH|nr:rhomboid family intramembrane serine protease [Candidatus Prometheoarchaeum syntrophicum]QEE17113.1 intramembrane serine protease GlpG [Candidatus Prometheoarchaeum syntrophicum]